MNGKYEINAQRWKEMDEDERSWIMFDTFNSYRMNTEKRFKRIEIGVLLCFLTCLGTISHDKVVPYILKLFI